MTLHSDAQASLRLPFPGIAWSWATARAGVARTNVFLYLVPVVSGSVAFFLLGERVRAGEAGRRGAS